MRYSRQLDTLRFVAVFFVLVEHLAKVVGTRISAGYFGVELFFVISGFLITSILFNCRKKSLKEYMNFICRRALRIMPLYFLVIILLFFLGYAYVHEYLLYCVTFTYNYAMIRLKIPTNAIAHFWSLCLEEQFYLLWPLIVLPLRGYKKLLLIFLSVYIVFCYGQFYYKWIPELSGYTWTGLIPRSYSIAIGAFGALAFNKENLAAPCFSSKLTEWLVIFVLLFFLTGHHPLKFVFIPLAALYLVLKCYHTGFSQRFVDSFFNNKKLIYWGTISYGIYLIHLPLQYYLERYFFIPYFWNKIDVETLGSLSAIKKHTWLIEFPLLTGMTVLLASISFTYIESPFLKWKNMYFRSDDNLRES